MRRGTSRPTSSRRAGRYLPYHTSCHQKLHRIGRPALDLLGLVPGLTVEEMGADCCGITGTYGYKHEKHAIAQAVGQPLFDKIVASGARQAVCDNETCRWNLAANTGLDVVHTVEVLAEAYGVDVMRDAWSVVCVIAYSRHSLSFVYVVRRSSFADSRLLCAY